MATSTHFNFSIKNSIDYCFRICLIAGLSLVALASCKENKAAPNTAVPNLLVIMTDEHNFRTLGSYREQQQHDQANVWGDGVNVETPNIDYLAKRGVLFNKFYAVTPLCTPSRAAFVSGMYPQAIDMTKNYLTLPDSVITFAHILKNNGYQTGYAGKWHLDGYGKPQWAPKRKFGFTDNKYMFNRGHWKKFKDTNHGPAVAAVNKKGNPGYGLDGADEETYATDYLTNKAMAFMDEHKVSPFAYMLSYPDPHGPDRVRSPYDTMYTNMDFEFPETYYKEDKNIPSWAQKDKRVQSSNQSQYFGMVKALDDNIGRLINYLRNEQLLQKSTIVVFTADHGDLRAEHHKMNKSNPLEASVKVPFIIFNPSKIEAGTIINNAFNSVDFFPTILKLMGQQVPSNMQGNDLTPLLSSPDQQSEWKDLTSARSDSWVADITSRYKLILSKNDDPWLIDMKEDPAEVKLCI